MQKRRRAFCLFRYTAGRFLIGHSTTLLSLYALIGLYKDKRPLLADNTDMIYNRLFRTSDISPYSANIAFVLYACDNDVRTSERQFKMKVFVNEEPVVIPGCKNDVCPYEIVQRRYANSVYNCNLKNICIPVRVFDVTFSKLNMSLFYYGVMIVFFMTL